MFRTLAKSIGKLLITFSEGQAKPRRKHKKPKRIPTERAFNRHATRLLDDREDHSISAGVVQILGIDQIKADLGKRWPEVQDRASRIVEKVIRQHLSDEDLYHHQEPDNYVLCFKHLDQMAAEAETRQIVAEIEEQLLASVPEYASASVQHTVSEIDCELVLESDDGPLAAISQQLAAIRNEVNDAVQRARKYLKSNAEVCYRPVWTCKTGFVESYIARLDRRSGNDLLEYLQLVSDATTLAELTAEIDGVVLGRAVAALHQSLQAGCAPTVTLPVNYHTLNSANARESYLDLCRSIPEGYRKHLTFEITAVPETAPETRLLEIIQAIRACGRSTSVEVDLNSKTWMKLLDKGISGLALDMRFMRRQDRDRLSELLRVARSAGVNVHIHRVNTRGAGRYALACEVASIDGEAIAARVDAPNRRYALKSPFGPLDTGKSTGNGNARVAAAVH